MTTLVRRERIARLVLAAVLLAITALIVVVLSHHDWRPQPIDRAIRETLDWLRSIGRIH